MPQTQFVTYVEHLRAIQPDAPILYMSAYGPEILEANGVGKATPFLQKPFLPATLIETVTELLRATSPH